MPDFDLRSPKIPQKGQNFSTLQSIIMSFLWPNKYKNCFSGPRSLICFKCPSSAFFSDLNKKYKVASFILFICQSQNINISILKMNKKGASLGFDEKKMASSVFGVIKNKNKNLPALSVFQKKWPEEPMRSVP